MTTNSGADLMKCTVALMHVECIAAFDKPYFPLPAKAIELLSAFYSALHPRYPLGINDLQTSGGSSFGDVKLSVSALGGHGRVEITPERMVCDLRGIRANAEDFAILKDFMLICDGVITSALGVTLQRREVIAVAWLKVADGKQAGLELLRRRGDSGLGLGGERYSDWSRHYSLTGSMASPSGVELALLLEQANSDDGDLFARGTYAISDRGSGLKDVTETIKDAFAEFEEVLKPFGLELSPEVARQ